MTVAVYGAAVLVILASLILGRAVCPPDDGGGRWWASPAIGLATLIVLAYAGIELPGRATSALVLVGIGLLIASVVLWRRRQSPLSLGDLLVALPPTFVASIPFISNGRVGVQGVSILNDAANHLIWTVGLQSSRIAHLYPRPGGYPLGPHAIVASTGSLTGMSLGLAFTGLLVALVPLTALTAQGLIGDQRLWRRLILGVMCSTGYLLAAYYAEGAFKEIIMAVLLLGFALQLESLISRWSQLGVARRGQASAALIVLVVGAVYTYSYLGVAWFGLTLLLVVLALGARAPSRSLAGLRGLLGRESLISIGLGALLAVILVIPVLSQIVQFSNQFGASPGSVGTIPAPLANLIHPLPAYESLGLFPSVDFRRDPTTGLEPLLVAFALVLLAIGVVWSLRRRRFVLPCAVAACAVAWWLGERSGSPYVAAKALAIAVPVLTGLILRPLLTAGRRLWQSALALAPAAVFCLIALDSSYRDLHNMPVGGSASYADLHSFAQAIGPHPVLFLGDDDFVAYQLHPAAVTAVAPGSASTGTAIVRPAKPVTSGDPLDFDSVSARTLDAYRWVVTSSSAYASQPPANFTLARRSGLYDLWRRTGDTRPRRTIESPATPGAVLDCHTKAGRRIAAERGTASVEASPVVVAGPSLLPGAGATFALALPKGTWTISVQYFSDLPTHFTIPGHQWTLPAYLGRQGPFFRLGNVTGTGTKRPVALTISTSRPSPITGLSGDMYTAVPQIAATRTPLVHHLVSLHRACGRYVDWYRTP